MMWKWLAIAVVMALSLGAVQNPDECEPKLAPADAYWGATRACLNAKTVTEDMIEKMIASDKPLDPFTGLRPTVENGRAMSAYKALLANPDVQARWPETVERLKELLAEARGESVTRDDARAATARVLAPRELYPLYTMMSSTMLLQSLPNGYDVAVGLKATVDSQYEMIDNENVSIMNIATGHELFSIRVPSDALYSYELTWHIDVRGTPWLYIAGESEEGDTEETRSTRIHLYRWRWGAKRLQKIPFRANVNREVHKVISISPEMILAEIGSGDRKDYFNLVSGKPVAHPELKPGPDLIAFDGRPYRLDPKKEAVFKTRGGRLLRATISDKIHVYDLHDPNFLATLPIPKGPEPNAMEFSETGGRVFLAVEQLPPKGKGSLTVYEPLMSTRPVFTLGSSKAVVVKAYHIFTSPEGELLVGVRVYSEGERSRTRIFAPETSGDQVVLELPEGVYGWLDSKGQTYFYTISGKGRSTFDLFTMHSAFHSTR